MRFVWQSLLGLLLLAMGSEGVVASTLEVRAVWLDRSSLLTRAEIGVTLDELRDANFNLVLVNVWSRGYPLWRSEVFAAATGHLIDPDYVDRDPLAEILEEAARRGLHVMPWFEYGFIGGYSGYYPGSSGQGPLFDRHPEWLARTRSGTTGFSAPGGLFYWMAAARPDVQDFLFRLVEEVVRRYGASSTLVGVQFDRARYPQLDCGYDEATLALFREETAGGTTLPEPGDPVWVAWRAARLNRFIVALRERVRAISPRLIVSNAPIVYPYSYVNFAQDYPAWLRQGGLDLVVPQIYRRDSAQFEAELDRQLAWLPEAGARSGFVPGLDSTNPTVDELVRMVELVRERGLPGVAIWYYRSLRNKGALAALRQRVFQEPARLPWALAPPRAIVPRPLPHAPRSSRRVAPPSPAP